MVSSNPRLSSHVVDTKGIVVMKLFKYGKDGGAESHVEGWWLIEWKSGFSIAVLKFSDGSRDAYHSHAFDAISWLLKGSLLEHTRKFDGSSLEIQDTIVHVFRTYTPSWLPIWTPRSRFHKVVSKGTSWVITFRGPWSKTWKEYTPGTRRNFILTNGRKIIHEYQS